MTVSAPIRFALVGVILFGLGTAGSAQPSPKRSGAGSSTAKSGAKPAAKSSPSKVRQASGTDDREKKPRPKTPQLRIEPLPPELEQILKDWERESAKIKRLVGEHERIVYNSVFEVQKIAKGQFYYESPDKGRIDLVGIEPKKGEKSKRKNPRTGQPYRIEKEQQSKWICTGQEILSINEEEKTYEMFPLPQELQGTNIINGPLPFLFGMKAEEAKKRFEISFFDVNDQSKNNQEVVWLVAKPRQMMDRDNFQEAVIMLDRQRYLPLAVKLKDPSGNLETIYNFPKDELQVNARAVLPAIFRNDPFHPNLKSYKLILPPEASREPDQEAPIQRASGSRPAKSKDAVRPKTSASGTFRAKK